MEYNQEDKILKRHQRILILSICLIVTLFLSSSYALLANFDQTEDIVTFKTGNLNMTINNTTGLLNLNGKLPQSDEVGITEDPIILNVTNTGTMEIKKYDIKLVKESDKNSTLNESYIKYAVSLDGGVNYTEPSILSSNSNIIYTGYSMEVGESKNIYLKIWLDESSGVDALNKIYYGSIQVDLYQEADVPVKVLLEEKMEAVTCKSTITDTDGTIYFSGTNDCVNYNYVWYSGKLWRITAIYPDGRMKLLTDNSLSLIYYGSNAIYYTDSNNTSWIYQWLNEDFKDTLYNYENILETNHKWDYTRVTSVSTKLNGTNVKEGPVGLLNTYEYYQSYQNSSYANGYLNIEYSWWLLNSASDTTVWLGYKSGAATNRSSVSDARSIRPSVVLKKGVFINDGDGTISNPYTIKGDIEKATYGETYLNERVSGEFVNFNNTLYRIVEIDNGDTKLSTYDLLKENGSYVQKYLASTLTFGLSTNTQNDNYFDYYLNNTWYNNIPNNYKNMLVKDTYYLGTNQNQNYKTTVCKTASNTVTIKNCEKTTNTYTGYVGIPRFGELFSTHFRYYYSDVGIYSILQLTSTSSNVTYVNANGVLNANSVTSFIAGTKPSITLSETVKIIGGLGTKDSPFEISL